MKISEKLEAAKALIADPKNWTQDTYARDVHGEPTSPESMDAVCWCSLGALKKTDSYLEGAGLLLRSISGVSKHPFIPSFNDTRTHEEVMAMWDRAIELAKSDEDGSAT